MLPLGALAQSRVVECLKLRGAQAQQEVRRDGKEREYAEATL